MLFFILFLQVQSESCSDRTNTFKNRGGPRNANNFYFVRDTYTSSTDIISSGTAFRNRIVNNFECTGEWCIFNDNRRGWSCKNATGNKNECYHAEHIIPQKNTINEIVGCSTDIIGNFVMAYGTWNVQLSNRYYGEKSLVYGDIFKLAYENVYKACRGKMPLTYPEVLCLNVPLTESPTYRPTETPTRIFIVQTNAPTVAGYPRPPPTITQQPTLNLLSDQCKYHTDLFIDHRPSNNDNYYFIPHTFIPGLGSHNAPNLKYLEDLIKKETLCMGYWCNENGTWPECDEKEQCYTLGYVISPSTNHDILGLESLKKDDVSFYIECDGNTLPSFHTRGNVVMMYSKWKHQLGDSFYGDRALIFGQEMVKSAYIDLYKIAHFWRATAAPYCISMLNPPFIPDSLCLYLPPYETEETENFVLQLIETLFSGDFSFNDLIASIDITPLTDAFNTIQLYSTYKYVGLALFIVILTVISINTILVLSLMVYLCCKKRKVRVPIDTFENECNSDSL